MLFFLHKNCQNESMYFEPALWRSFFFRNCAYSPNLMMVWENIMCMRVFCVDLHLKVQTAVCRTARRLDNRPTRSRRLYNDWLPGAFWFLSDINIGVDLFPNLMLGVFPLSPVPFPSLKPARESREDCWLRQRSFGYTHPPLLAPTPAVYLNPGKRLWLLQFYAVVTRVQCRISATLACIAAMSTRQKSYYKLFPSWALGYTSWGPLRQSTWWAWQVVGSRLLDRAEIDAYGH